MYDYGKCTCFSCGKFELIKGAEEFNPVVDGKALGLDSLILIKDYQDPKSTNWKIAADTIAVLGDGIAVVTDFTPAGLARKIAIGTSLDLMRKAVKGFDTSSGGDGCVDASDDGWSKLRVWMDNGDGFSQENLGQYAVQST